MTGRCWLCGHPCPALDAAEPRCLDVAQCFARSVAPPGAPSAHPAGTGACDPEEGCCDACAGAYAEVDADARDNEEETTQ